MNSSVTKRVERLASFLFPAKDAADILLSLDQAHFPLASGNSERINLAILLLSHGKLDLFRTSLSQAIKSDWRDTLVAADLADEDWETILQIKTNAAEQDAAANP